MNQAIETTAGSSMHFGDRLCNVLGDAEALKFMRFVFQAAQRVFCRPVASIDP